MSLLHQIEGAVAAAPNIAIDEPIPYKSSNGLVAPSAPELPGAARGDYDPYTFGEGLDQEPVNGVIVNGERFPDLLEAYSKFVVSSCIAERPDPEVLKAVVQRKEKHANAFAALGAERIWYGMRFAKTDTGQAGRELIRPVAFTAAPGLETFTLGAAAVIAAPDELQEADEMDLAKLGYTPGDVIRKISDHNAARRSPYLPEPSAAKLR